MFWVGWFSLVCDLRFAGFTLVLLVSIVNLVDFLCLICCWECSGCCWLCGACCFWFGGCYGGKFAFVGLVVGLFVA